MEMKLLIRVTGTVPAVPGDGSKSHGDGSYDHFSF